jgi:DNA polymerase-3 subunit gamma/tau
MNLQFSLKYRPKTFNDVFYHSELKTVLTNYLLSKDIPNAILLYGDRGVGKTTIARIFVKALNCLNPADGFDPCNECSSCTAINSFSHPDVIEIDAASKNTVDSVRDLIDASRYLPIMSKYRVYILDEVHMFSNSAFNSLLKILEEPPSHIKFILNTTEYHKIPKTVISRCQRLNFKRIPNNFIELRLKEICNLEKIRIEERALSLIAIAANGSFRDGVSLLDQASILTKKNVTLSEVVKILGYQEDNQIFFDILNKILDGNVSHATNLTLELYKANVSEELFFERILDMTLNLILRKNSSNPGKIDAFFDISDEKIEILLTKINLNQLNKIWDLFANGLKFLKTNFYENNLNLMLLVVARAASVKILESNQEKIEQSPKINYPKEEISKSIIPSINETITSIPKPIEQEKIVEQNIPDAKEKQLGFEDFLRAMFRMNEKEMVRMAQTHKNIFDFEKYEIYDFNNIPARYLQFFFKTLRNITKDRWRIVIKTREEIPEGIDNKNDSIQDNLIKIEEERNLTRPNDFEKIKREIIDSDPLFKKLKDTFGLDESNIKISK